MTAETCQPSATLASITTKIGSGATPRGGAGSYKSEGISLIRSLNVYDFRFDYGDLAYIDEQQAQRLSNVEIESDDILLNITGASVGRCCMVPEELIPARVNQHVSIIRIEKSVAVPKFIFYTINSPSYKGLLLSIANGGATREALTKSDIEGFQVPLPPITIQKKIASVLSAYDDLIENNERRIKILEEMAQSIYREWFVNYRFPGHENVRMVDSEWGEIPEGWEITSIRNCISGYIGGGWGKDEPEAGTEAPAFVIRGTDIPVVRHSNVTTVPFRFHKQSTLGRRLLTESDIVIEVSGGSKDRPTGRSLLVSKELLKHLDGDVICASFCKRMGVEKSVVSPYILIQYFQNLYDTDAISQYDVQSTGIKNLKFEVLLDEEAIALPSSTLQNEYEKLSAPLLTEIQYLGLQNQNLRHTRDLLLPKLISGELDVEELDIAVP